MRLTASPRALCLLLVAVVGGVKFGFEELEAVDELEAPAPEATDERKVEAVVDDEPAALAAASFERHAVLVPWETLNGLLCPLMRTFPEA